MPTATKKESGGECHEKDSFNPTYRCFRAWPCCSVRLRLRSQGQLRAASPGCDLYSPAPPSPSREDERRVLGRSPESVDHGGSPDRDSRPVRQGCCLDPSRSSAAAGTRPGFWPAPILIFYPDKNRQHESTPPETGGVFSCVCPLSGFQCRVGGRQTTKIPRSIY